MNIGSALKKLNKKLKRKYNLENYIGKKNLHLGCGNKPMKNFINVDYYNKQYADEIVNLNQRLPYEAESIDLIYSDNVFEHIENLLGLIKECHRVLKKGGTLIIKVPYFKSKHAFVDPTHINFFTIQSMDYFVKDTYFNNEYRFFEESFESMDIFLDAHEKSIFKKLISIYAIMRPNNFENSIWSSVFVFHNIVYILRK